MKCFNSYFAFRRLFGEDDEKPLYAPDESGCVMTISISAFCTSGRPCTYVGLLASERPLIVFLEPPRNEQAKYHVYIARRPTNIYRRPCTSTITRYMAVAYVTIGGASAEYLSALHQCTGVPNDDKHGNVCASSYNGRRPRTEHGPNRNGGNRRGGRHQPRF